MIVKAIFSLENLTVTTVPAEMKVFFFFPLSLHVVCSLKLVVSLWGFEMETIICPVKWFNKPVKVSVVLLRHEIPH